MMKKKIKKEIFYAELQHTVSAFSKRGIYSPTKLLIEIPDSLSFELKKNKSQTIITRLALSFKEKKQYGKLSIILCIIINFDSTYFEAIENNGLLLCDFQVEKKYLKMLYNLKCQFDEHERYEIYKNRILTYIIFYDLNLSLSQHTLELKNTLKNRSIFLVKSILCCSELFFFITYFDLNGISIPDWLNKVYSRVKTPENFASIVSYLIWQANDISPIKPIEFEIPVDIELESDEIQKTIYGAIFAHSILRISKKISYFNYSLEKIKVDQKTIIKIHPPSQEFEYFLRLGYIREQVNRKIQPFTILDQNIDDYPSLNMTTKSLAESKLNYLAQWIEKPFPRLRMILPYSETNGFPLKELINKITFQEEAMILDLLVNEYLVTPNQKLTDNLMISDFITIYMAILSSNLLNINLISEYNRMKKKFSFNSMIRVQNKIHIKEFASLFEFDEDQFNDFLDLISWDSAEGSYYDLQYAPFLKCENSYMTLPCTISTSNIIRNIQVSNRIRVPKQGDKFVEICSRLFKMKFKKVVTEKRIKKNNVKTEIDMVVLYENYLYLFECKYSVPPYNSHELRNTWAYVKKGITQQKIANKILSEETILKAYLDSWFPNNGIRNYKKIKVKNCILLSGRNFSGMTIDDIPIRDFHSLNAILSEGQTSFGIAKPDEQSTLIKYSLVGQNGFTHKDLNDYLSNKSKYFKMFKVNMKVTSNFDELIPNKLTITEEIHTYSKNSNDEFSDYIQKMDEIGFIRMPDEIKKIEFPKSIEDIIDSKQTPPKKANN